MLDSRHPIESAKDKLIEVLNSNVVAFRGVCESSLNSIGDQMVQLHLITDEVRRNISYDGIISSFTATMQIKTNPEELKRHCLKFIFALNAVGGPVSEVAQTILHAWTNIFTSDLRVQL